MRLAEVSPGLSLAEVRLGLSCAEALSGVRRCRDQSDTQLVKEFTQLRSRRRISEREFGRRVDLDRSCSSSPTPQFVKPITSAESPTPPSEFSDGSAWATPSHPSRLPACTSTVTQVGVNRPDFNSDRRGDLGLE